MGEKVDRMTRVNELLKREIANLIERGLVESSGTLVSVTEVKTGVDLRNATVQVSIFGGTPGICHKVMRQLAERRVTFQRELARTLGFKHTPVLEFRLDERTERGDRVLELLNSLEETTHADDE